MTFVSSRRFADLLTAGRVESRDSLLRNH